MEQTVGIEGTEELAYTTYFPIVLIRVFESKSEIKLEYFMDSNLDF